MFFWCYLSSPLPLLIDMFHIEKTQIPKVPRGAPAVTPVSFWSPGPSALIARCASGVYSPERATSKMGYEAKTIRLSWTVRVGLDPLWRLAQPPGA